MATLMESYQPSLDHCAFDSNSWTMPYQASLNQSGIMTPQPVVDEEEVVPVHTHTAKRVLKKRKRGEDEKKKRKRRKTSRDFDREEFVSLMHLTQRQAAKELDICLSTFKRQFSNLRPKLTWPTPSERQNLIRRKRFEEIIHQNEEAQEYISSSQFEFGKSNESMYQGEFFPNVDSLLQEYKSLKEEVKVLNRALQKNASLEKQAIEIPSSRYGGNIELYTGDWTNVSGASICLLDVEMNVVSSNPSFNDLVGCTEEDLNKQVNFCSLMPNLHQRSTHVKWFTTLIMEKQVQTIRWNETLSNKQTGEAQHVEIILHSHQGGRGAWLEIRPVLSFNASVTVDGVVHELEGSNTTGVQNMTSSHDLIHHMKVFQVIKSL